MADESIVIGEEQLDYYFRLQEVVEDLSAANQALMQIGEELESVYQGKALEEIQLYFGSLTTHQVKMIMLYGKAMQYVYNAFEQLKLGDAECAELILRELEERGYVQQEG